MTTASTVSLPQIISNIAESLSKKIESLPERLKLTKRDSFVFPFEHTVIQGLISGERNEGRLRKIIRQASCKKAVTGQYANRLERQELYATVQDLFNAAYGFGTVLGRIEGLRDQNNQIMRVDLSQGERFVSVLMEGLNVAGDQATAKSIWRIY